MVKPPHWNRVPIIIGLTLIGALCASAMIRAGGVPRMNAQLIIRAIPAGTNVLPLVSDAQTNRAFAIDRSDNSVRVLDIVSGKLLRIIHVGGPASFYDNSVIVSNHGQHVFIAGFDGTITLLDAHSGALLRDVNVGGHPTFLAMAQQSGRLIVSSFGDSSDGNSISILDTLTGNILSKLPIRLVPQGIVVADEINRAFVFSNSDGPSGVPGSISILDVGRSRLLRTIKTGTIFGIPIIDVHRQRLVMLEESRSAMKLGLFDARNGNLIHSTTIPGGIDNIGVVEDERIGHIVIGSTSGQLTILDANSGAILHRSVVSHYGAAPPVLDSLRHHIFIANYQDGTVSMVDSRDGSVIGKANVGSNLGALVIDDVAGRAYVLVDGAHDKAGIFTDQGLLAVLSTQTGQLLYFIPVGVNPANIVINDSAKRAVVLSAGGTVRISSQTVASKIMTWLPSMVRSFLPFVPEPSSQFRIVPSSLTVLDIAHS